MSYAHRDTLERRGVTQHRLAAPVEVILMVVSRQRVVKERRDGVGGGTRGWGIGTPPVSVISASPYHVSVAVGSRKRLPAARGELSEPPMLSNVLVSITRYPITF